MNSVPVIAVVASFGLLFPESAVLPVFHAALAEASAKEASVQSIVALTTYPRLAQLAVVQGRVRLVARIKEDGSVQSVRRVVGPGILSHDAERTLMKWRFSTCDSGCGVREVEIKFDFVLEGECVLPDCQVDFRFNLPDTVTVKTQKARAIID